MPTAPEAVSIAQDMRMVVNGGKEEVDSATLPIQFFFSEEIVQKMTDDAYVVLIDSRRWFDSPDRFQYCDNGSPRSLHKLSKGIKFLQINSAGKHHLVALLFCGPEAEQNARRMMTRENGEYANSIEWRGPINKLGFLSSGLKSYVCAATEMYIDVPEQLFASKPRGRIGRAIWNYVNLWHEGSPTDECHYRKRMLISVPKLPFALIVLAFLCIKYAFAYTLRACLATIMVMVGCIVFYTGFKTNNLWTQVVEIMKWNSRDGTDFLAFEGEQRYRLWKSSNRRYRHYSDGCRWMPITGLELTLLLGPVILWFTVAHRAAFGDIMGSFKMLNSWSALVMFALVPAAICAFVLIWRTCKWFTKQPVWHRFMNRRAERRIARAQRAKKSWFAFLEPVTLAIAVAISGTWRFLTKPIVAMVEKALKSWQDGAPTREQRAEARRVVKEATMSQVAVRKAAVFQDWVGANFTVAHIPPRVEIATVPPPPRAKDRIVQKLYVSYWRLKGQVCRPFAR